MSSAVEWLLCGALSATAVAIGVRRHRPARTGPWALLAASVLSLAAGDVCYALGAAATANLAYTAMYVLVALFLFRLTRGGETLLDRARLIDLVAFTCSALLLVWVFVLGRGGPLGEISAANVLGDLLLAGITARLIIASWRNWSALLLGAGALGLLASDLGFPLLGAPEGELGYLAFYLAWGAAALHPSMARLTVPVPPRPVCWQGRWAALLGVSVAVPPAVLLIEACTDGVTDGVVIAAAGAITLALTFTRLTDALRRHSAALAREQSLREASAALVAAADVPAVDEAIRQAVARLLPSGVRTIVLATDDGRLNPFILPTPEPHPRPATEPRPRSTAEPYPRPAAEPYPRPTTEPHPRSTAEPDPRTAAEPYPRPAAEPLPRPRSWWVEPPGDTLVCPLWLEPLAVARPSGGALVLTGNRDLLTAGRDTLEILAGQAALALDRIALVEAVGRHDSDLYLRTVINNTAEAMLVIDSDQRIRYASPALRDLAGVTELPPLAALRDLLDPGDRAEVHRALQTDGDGVVYCALRRPDDTRVLVEATYRDLRRDRLVRGFVVTMRDLSTGRGEQQAAWRERPEELPGWLNRRNGRHKFRY